MIDSNYNSDRLPINTFTKIKTKVNAHECRVINEIQSHAFKLQALYFEIGSSKYLTTYLNIISQGSTKLLKQNYLDNSFSDRQLIYLMNQLKAFLKQDAVDLSSAHQARIQQILHQLEEAKITCLLAAMVIEVGPVDEKRILQQVLVDHLKQRFLNLPINNSLIIPCGYMNGNFSMWGGLFNQKGEGHAIVLEVSRLSNHYQARIFNTNSSVVYHFEDKEQNFTKLYPCCIKNIQLSSLIDELFLNKLVSFACNDASQLFKTEDVYICLEHYLGKLDTINSEKKSYQLQGPVGNCSKKSLQVWLHDQLQDMEDLYKKFHIFSLQKKIEAIEEIEKQGTHFTYIPSFMHVHKLATKVVSVIQSLDFWIMQRQADTYITPIKLRQMLDQAYTLLDKRIQGPYVSNRTIENIFSIAQQFNKQKNKDAVLCNLVRAITKGNEVNQALALMHHMEAESVKYEALLITIESILVKVHAKLEIDSDAFLKQEIEQTRQVFTAAQQLTKESDKNTISREIVRILIKANNVEEALAVMNTMNGKSSYLYESLMETITAIGDNIEDKLEFNSNDLLEQEIKQLNTLQEITKQLVSKSTVNSVLREIARYLAKTREKNQALKMLRLIMDEEIL